MVSVADRISALAVTKEGRLGRIEGSASEIIATVLRNGQAISSLKITQKWKRISQSREVRVSVSSPPVSSGRDPSLLCLQN